MGNEPPVKGSARYADQEHRKRLDVALRTLGQAPAGDLCWEHFSFRIDSKTSDDEVDDLAEDIARARDIAPAPDRTIVADTALQRPTRTSAKAGGPESKSPPAAPPSSAGGQAATDLPSWEQYLRRVFAALDLGASLIRHGLMIREPKTAEEVAPWLRSVREHERHEGDQLRLEVPILQEGVWRLEAWTVYRGYTLHGRVDTQPPQPLFELARGANRIHGKTGILQVEAVLYILTGKVPDVPVATATVTRTPRFSLLIRVEWPFVEPKVIDDLLKRARGSLFLPQSASVEDQRALGTKNRRLGRRTRALRPRAPTCPGAMG